MEEAYPMLILFNLTYFLSPLGLDLLAMRAVMGPSASYSCFF